ncbi:hypothetical protein [Sphingomonas bacterium]|uniref:hypothetical protein n=1 Tax=Sphingomonas bacterium TaxID=1895847 RepID=UPI002605E6DF|nr:hypothetical protein [Sphingomonas bacterium]
MDMSNEIAEIDRNYEAFLEQLPEILPQHRGQYAVMHDRNIVAYCGNALAAMIEGVKRFGEGRFSVQEVTTDRDNLGFYSYAGGSGQA